MGRYPIDNDPLGAKKKGVPSYCIVLEGFTLSLLHHVCSPIGLALKLLKRGLTEP